MKRAVWSRARRPTFALLLILTASTVATGQSPCAFTPAESHFAHVDLQASFQWFEDQFSPPHTSASTGTLLVNATEIYDSAASGYRLDGKCQASTGPTGVNATLSGSGDLKSYLEKGDTFTIGALTLHYVLSQGLEGELTGGLGIGRFRDVTPLAKAIRIQDRFLDEGILLGPIPAGRLQTLAQVIDAVDLSSSARLTAIEQEIVATGLTQGDALGARALTEIEDVLASTEEARLCGWEVQARAGLAVSAVPEPRLSEAIAFSWHYAAVPDPVSQWQASADWVSGLALLDRYSLAGSISYSRRIGDALRVRGSYDLSRDLLWNTSHTTPFDHHELQATLISQLSAQLSLTVSLQFVLETGYEQPTKTLSVQLSYDAL